MKLGVEKIIEEEIEKLMNSKLVEQLKRHEGYKQNPYKDTVGKLTIGYGRNLDDKGIYKTEAEQLLLNDIDEVVENLTQEIPWIIRLNDARRFALFNMAFNMGVQGLLGFRKMLSALSNKDYYEAAKQALDSKWSRQVGSRSLELAEQLRSGIMKHES